MTSMSKSQWQPKRVECPQDLIYNNMMPTLETEASMTDSNADESSIKNEHDEIRTFKTDHMNYLKLLER
jgi:hypothetical protein